MSIKISMSQQTQNKMDQYNDCDAKNTHQNQGYYLIVCRPYDYQLCKRRYDSEKHWY